MTPDLHTADDLRLRLDRRDAERLPVSFLIGSPFSTERGRGVPGVAGFVEEARARVGRAGPDFLSRLDAELAGAEGAALYQRAMAFVYRALDARAAGDVVRAAVLRARLPDAPPLGSADDDGDPADWAITSDQRARRWRMARARSSRKATKASRW